MDKTSFMCSNVDIHICGSCRKEFSELQEFMQHKKYMCRPPASDGNFCLLYKDQSPSTDHVHTTLLDSTSSEGSEKQIDVPMGLQLQEPGPNGTTTAASPPASAPVLSGNQLDQLDQQDQVVLANIDSTDNNQSTVYQIHSEGMQVLGNVSLQALQLLQQQQQLQAVLQQQRPQPQELLQHDVIQPNSQPNLIQSHDKNVSYHRATLTDAIQCDSSTITDLIHNHSTNQAVQALHSTLTEMQLEQQVKDLAIDTVMSTEQNIQASPIQGSLVKVLTSQPSVTLDIQAPAVEGDQFIQTTEFGSQPQVQSTTNTSTSVQTPAKPEPKSPEKSSQYRYRCTVQGCNYVTHYSKNVDRHMFVHTGEKPFVCTECNSRFSRSDKLKSHQRVHTGERPFKCPECDYTCADNSSLTKHRRIHTDERPFKCQICSYASRNSSQLTVHLRIHTGDKPFMCPECNATFKVKSDLKRHRRMHTGEKPYACNLCSFRTAVNSNLNAHKKTYHCEENMISCKSCEFRSSSKRVFKTHLKTHSPTEKKLLCQHCTYTCCSMQLMKIHVDTHSDERPHGCTFCKYTTKTRTCLNSHVRNKHPREYFTKHSRRRKMHAAALPDKTDAKKLQKRSPMMAKCWEKHKCDICEAGFVRADSLRSHIRSHKEKAEYDSEQRRLTLEQMTSATVTCEEILDENQVEYPPKVKYQIEHEHEYAAAMHSGVQSESTKNVSGATTTQTGTSVAPSDKMTQYREIQNLLPFIQNNHNTAVWENMQNLAAMNHGAQLRSQQGEGHQSSQNTTSPDRSQISIRHEDSNLELEGDDNEGQGHGEKAHISTDGNNYAAQVHLLNEQQSINNKDFSHDIHLHKFQDHSKGQGQSQSAQCSDGVTESSGSQLTRTLGTVEIVHIESDYLEQGPVVIVPKEESQFDDQEVTSRYSVTDIKQETEHAASLDESEMSTTSVPMLSTSNTTNAIQSLASSSLPSDLQEVLRALNLPKGTMITIPYGDHQLQVQTLQSEDKGDTAITQYAVIECGHSETENNNSPGDHKTEMPDGSVYEHS